MPRQGILPRILPLQLALRSTDKLKRDKPQRRKTHSLYYSSIPPPENPADRPARVLSISTL